MKPAICEPIQVSNPNDELAWFDLLIDSGSILHFWSKGNAIQVAKADYSIMQ